MKMWAAAAMVGVLAGVPAGAQPVRAKVQQRILEKQKARQEKQGDVLERFLAMTPQERRQALAQLPPARQRQILQRLRAVELLSDEERELLRGRLQTVSAWPPERRQAVLAELRTLRRMSQPERRRRLGSEELKQRFSSEELQLLYEVAGQGPPQ